MKSSKENMVSRSPSEPMEVNNVYMKFKFFLSQEGRGGVSLSFKSQEGRGGVS